MSCIVIGDSIAVGIAQQLPQCVVEAYVGITSSAILTRIPRHQQADLVIISIGVNDAQLPYSLDNMRQLRKSLGVCSAVWILPFDHARNYTRHTISTVAKEFNDTVVEVVASLVGNDLIHPTQLGYKQLAKSALDLTLCK